MREGVNQPWFVIRDGAGKVLDSAMCLGDEESQKERLIKAIAIRETRGYRIEQLDAWSYRATSRIGEIELLSIEAVPP